jgi:hypothetical protein
MPTLQICESLKTNVWICAFDNIFGPGVSWHACVPRGYGISKEVP